MGIPWRLSPLPCPSLFFFFPLFFSVTGACFLPPRGGSWLGCLDLPAMGAVSIWELAANSGSSWMSQAPNLHFARQLLIRVQPCACCVFTSSNNKMSRVYSYAKLMLQNQNRPLTQYILASPVPGGPYNITPFGGLIPISSYNSG